jgi:hypothetical protein
MGGRVPQKEPLPFSVSRDRFETYQQGITACPSESHLISAVIRHEISGITGKTSSEHELKIFVLEFECLLEENRCP